MANFDTPSVLGASREVWASVLEATEGLTEEQWSLPTSCPGWDVSDQVAHLSGVELMLLGEPAPEVAVDHLDHVVTPFHGMVEVWIEARRPIDGAGVRGEFAEVVERRLAQIAAMSEAELDEVSWSPVGDIPRREFFGSVRILDSWIHEQDIREALGRPGGRFGWGELITLDRAELALPRVVGKGAGAPEGASVAFELHGPHPRRYRIEVNAGRAESKEASGATTTIQLDQGVYLRRFAGRISAAEALGHPLSTVSGDAQLGQRVLEALAVMI